MKNSFIRKPHRKKHGAIYLDDLEKIWQESDISDINGSYTGTPKDGDIPEQDPDDL